MRHCNFTSVCATLHVAAEQVHAYRQYCHWPVVRCTDEGGGGRRGDSTASGLWLGVQMRGWGRGEKG